jgi:hypothetical protein
VIFYRRQVDAFLAGVARVASSFGRLAAIFSARDLLTCRRPLPSALVEAAQRIGKAHAARRTGVADRGVGRKAVTVRIARSWPSWCTSPGGPCDLALEAVVHVDVRVTAAERSPSA